MPIQLKLSTRAHHNYPAYAKTFRNTCASSRASETIQPATQDMGSTSSPKNRTRNKKMTKSEDQSNKSFHAQKKTTGLESTEGLTKIPAKDSDRIFIFCPDFDPSHGLLDRIFTILKRYYRSHRLVDRIFFVLVAFWLAPWFFNRISPVFTGFWPLLQRDNRTNNIQIGPRGQQNYSSNKNLILTYNANLFVVSSRRQGSEQIRWQALGCHFHKAGTQSICHPVISLTGSTNQYRSLLSLCFDRCSPTNKTRTPH